MHWLLTGPLSIEKLTVEIPDLPASLQGIKLVQMSDFHYDGVRLSDELLNKAIIESNEAEPDLVFLTGDFITRKPTHIYQLTEKLKHLESRYGIYAVLGNHEHYQRGVSGEVATALTNIGIHVLCNQIAYPLGKELPIVGLNDYRSRDFNPTPVMNQLDPKIPCIVLCHNPDGAEILKKWRVDLQLSGHTHGGQINIPYFGSITKLITLQSQIRRRIPHKLRRFIPFMAKDLTGSIKNLQWLQGYHQVGSNQLYVNRGLGTYAPGRLCCPPEVTVITLTVDG
ncbi:MAG: metallophosphoesterase [Scytonematopsis contorta HA4267-MV1]|jgi:hypothetical protein|nr:metallophosphoesterase [Scytonematopsis contorta HA4267-MV1]